MRIRKNANLSSVVFSHASEEETHVCLLNQSPWDVIPFSQLEPHPSSSTTFNHQFEGEDGFIPNGSFSDSMCAVESVASMKDERDDKVGVIDNEMPNFSNYDDDNVQSEIDGLELSRDWQCDNNNNTMPKDESKCSSFKTNTPVIPTPVLTKKQEKTTTTATPRRGRGKGVKNKGTTSAANPYEYYYYSGFGPKWGKRRGAITEQPQQRRQSEDNNDNGINDSSDNTMTNANQNDKSSSSIDKHKSDNNGGSDYMDEDTEYEDDDEDLDGDSQKKRLRKPVKARSLKSLM